MNVLWQHVIVAFSMRNNVNEYNKRLLWWIVLNIVCLVRSSVQFWGQRNPPSDFFSAFSIASRLFSRLFDYDLRCRYCCLLPSIPALFSYILMTNSQTSHLDIENVTSLTVGDNATSFVQHYFRSKEHEVSNPKRQWRPAPNHLALYQVSFLGPVDIELLTSE